jgi:hypothetical protein
MTKHFTISQIAENLKNKNDEVREAENLSIEFGDVQKVIESKPMQAPQNSVDFVLNFSKAFKTEKLNNGDYAEMIIN